MTLGMAGHGRRHLLSMLVLTMMGCGGSLRMRVPDVKVAPNRTVVLPTSAAGYTLDADGNHLGEAERTAALEGTIGVEFERQARAKGAMPVPFDKVRACGANCVSLLSTLIRWGENAAYEIAAEKSGLLARSGRSSVGEWRNGRDFRPLQRAMDADFALLTYIRDVEETGGRQLADANLLSRSARAVESRPDDVRRALVACAVELRSGRMVWCSSIVDRWIGKRVDTSSTSETRRLVQEVLAEF